MEKKPRFWKELFIAVTLFVLPFTPYFHLLFIGFDENSMLQMLSNNIFDMDIDLFVYAIIGGISYALLFYIWYAIHSHYNKNFILIILGVIILQFKNYFTNNFIFSPKEIAIGFMIVFIVTLYYSYYLLGKRNLVYLRL